MEKLVKKSNVLLAKDDVGKPKPVTFKLPKGDHVFGKPDNKDQEGAGIITGSWATHKSSKSIVPQKDFRKINKFGISQPINVKVSLHFNNMFCRILSQDSKLVRRCTARKLAKQIITKRSLNKIRNLAKQIDHQHQLRESYSAIMVMRPHSK